ncbi:hypothetical protein NXX40_12665 [Parabacteroides distasonis]|nr:hypothetical protein [Parabacteroides distasonis]
MPAYPFIALFLAQYALYITEYRTKVTRVFAAFLASVVSVVMIAILLTVFSIIDPVGIVGQYTQNASTLDMVQMVSKVLVHPKYAYDLYYLHKSIDIRNGLLPDVQENKYQDPLRYDSLDILG